MKNLFKGFEKSLIAETSKVIGGKEREKEYPDEERGRSQCNTTSNGSHMPEYAVCYNNYGS